MEYKFCIAIGLLIIISSSISVLVITIKYAFLNERNNYQSSMCKIQNCTANDIYDCCPTNGFIYASCHKCYDTSLILKLDNINKYIKTIQYPEDDKFENLCYINIINCYYDIRNITESLRIDNNFEPINGIIGIVLLSVWIFSLIIISILWWLLKY